MESSSLIIQKRRLIHCARGPNRCDKCRDMERETIICLVEYFPEPSGIARPVDEFEFNGKKIFCEFDIVRRFEDEKGARVFAVGNSITVDL